MHVEITGKTEKAVGVLREHMKDSKKFKNRVQLKAFGIRQELKENVLFISFGSLMGKIIKKGGEYRGIDDLKKSDFLSSVAKAMRDAGVGDDEWGVVINE